MASPQRSSRDIDHIGENLTQWLEGMRVSVMNYKSPTSFVEVKRVDTEQVNATKVIM